MDLTNKVYEACVRGGVALADSLLATVQGLAQGEDREGVASLRGYLMVQKAWLIIGRMRPTTS